MRRHALMLCAAAIHFTILLFRSASSTLMPTTISWNHCLVSVVSYGNNVVLVHHNLFMHATIPQHRWALILTLSISVATATCRIE